MFLIEDEPVRTQTPYERLCSFENLLLAYREAACGKRRRPDVARSLVSQPIHSS